MRSARFLQRWLGVLACMVLLDVPAANAQTPGQPNLPLPGQRPPPPTGTITPNFSIEIQPGGTIINDPSGMNLPLNVAPAASAAFEPALGSIGRPMEYRVTITANQQVRDLPNVPQIDGLQLTPGVPRYSSMWLNGQQVITSILRFEALASRTGEFTVPGFPVEIGGRRINVPQARLTVTSLQPGESPYQPLRVVIDVPKRDFFVGEVISARLLFIATPDEQPQHVQHVAKSSGGVLFKPSMLTRREQFTWEGKQANGLVMPVQITPLLAGDTEVNCQVIVHVSNITGNRFPTQTTIDVPSVRFKVLPLPQVGRPPGFTGAIGQFTIAQPKLSATEVEVGEPLSLSVALTGEGNLDGVPAPELQPGADWTSYRPTTEMQRMDDVGAGTKVFTYTLIPKREGRKGTPALPFAYFDPVKRAFVDITVPPIPIVVKASASVAAQPTAVPTAESSAPIEPPRETEPVLTGLSEQPGTWRRALGAGLESFLWFQLLPPAILLTLWLSRKRAEYLARHPEILRRRRARAAARRALANARAAVRRGDHSGFVQASLGALCEAAAPLDTADSTSLTREAVLKKLKEDERAERAARSIFETAEAARYSSVKPNGVQATELLPEVEHAVAHLSSRR